MRVLTSYSLSYSSAGQVREWALKCLDKISDTELTDFILPLCQARCARYAGRIADVQACDMHAHRMVTVHSSALWGYQVVKYEGYHDSALANWLLRRAVASPMIGHIVFWNMKSELHLANPSAPSAALRSSFSRSLLAPPIPHLFVFVQPFCAQ